MRSPSRTAPARRSPRPSVVLATTASALLLLPAAAQAGSVGAAPFPERPEKPRNSTRIVGGQQRSITTVPYQVFVSSADSGVDGQGADYEACGGTILDARHILTAAHCTYMPSPTPGQPAVERPPASYKVWAGSSQFDGVTPVAVAPAGDDPQGSTVSAVRRHPGYVYAAEGDPDEFVDDVAVLTLVDPLTLGGPAAQALTLNDVGAGPFDPTPAFASGYGLQVDPSPPNENAVPDGKLYGVDQVLLDASDPTLSGAANALILASEGPGSICQGDSGGPLVTGAGASTRLIGIVSFSGLCAAGEAAGFTNVSAGEIRNFIDQAVTDPLIILPPPLAPRGGDDVSLSFDRNPPRPGDELTCGAGTWSNLPSYAYTFTDTKSGTVLQNGPDDDTYEVQASDAGRTIACRATATTAGGVGRTPITLSLDAVERPRGTPPTTPPANPTPPASPAPPATPGTPTPPPTTPAKKGRLSLSVSTSPSSVRAGGRLSVTVTLVNRGAGRVRNPSVCIALPRATSVVSRGGATLRNRRLCWRPSSLAPAASTRQKAASSRFTRRVVLRIDRDARRGTLRLGSTATGTGVTRAASSDRVTIRPRAIDRNPGGVTG